MRDHRPDMDPTPQPFDPTRLKEQAFQRAPVKRRPNRVVHQGRTTTGLRTNAARLLRAHR